MTPIVAYTALVGLVAAQRLWETKRSRRNAEALLARGATEHGAGHFPVMVALHGLWLVACVLEPWLLTDGPPALALALGGLAALIVGQFLRISAMRALGPRWSARVLVVPDAPLVASGIFRWFRHPNYIGVIIELAALPLVFGAWRTALFFSVANLILLRHRVRVEEEALGG